MFSRIMAMVLAVILLLSAALATLSVWNLRAGIIDQRLEELKREGREIAYLAAQNRGTTVTWGVPWGSGFSFGDSSYRGATVTRGRTTSYITWKAEQIYQEYGAYIIVVDSNGRVMDNYFQAAVEDPAFASSLNQRELSDALAKVLKGEEIAVRAMVSGDPTFTVGVPFTQEGMVLGAVLIRTKAVQIEAGLSDMIVPIVLRVLLAVLLGGAAILLYLRRVLRPLHQMTAAAAAMSEGDFSARVEVDNAAPEIMELSKAFNTMSDKLARTEQSRREFVANVSHELRSPITSISGFVEGMEDGTIPPEEHSKYLALVGAETRRLTKLIRDLLALSRLERDDAALEWSDFNICEMLRRAVIRRMTDLEKKGIEVEPDFDADPCMVHADADRIEQVIVNLMDNAIKFTPSGGKLTLRTRTEGGLCAVTVADNGAGILPEDRPRVFERFFTADRAHTAGKGTGLGLSICQRIVQMHGQTIRLEDTEIGAAFTFTLALAAGKEADRHDKGSDRPEK